MADILEMKALSQVKGKQGAQLKYYMNSSEKNGGPNQSMRSHGGDINCEF